MTALEAYALFGAPLMMFLTGLAVYFITMRFPGQDRSRSE